MTLTSKQIGIILGVIALGLVGMVLVNAPGLKDFAGPAVILVALAAAAGVVASGSGGTAAVGLDGVGDAVRRAASGERPNTPAQASPEVMRVYDELSSMADRVRKQEADFATKQSDLQNTERVL